MACSDYKNHKHTRGNLGDVSFAQRKHLTQIAKTKTNIVTLTGMLLQASRYKHPLESSAPLHQLGHNTTALGKSFDKRNATVWDTVIRKAVTLPSFGFQQSKFNIMLEQKKQ